MTTAREITTAGAACAGEHGTPSTAVPRVPEPVGRASRD